MRNIKEILFENGYSDSMVRFFADATYPFSENTLNMILKKQEFFDIYMSYAEDVFSYSQKHPNMFFNKKKKEEFLKEYQKRYKKCFLSEDGKFVYPPPPQNEFHLWITGGNTDQDY